MTNSIGPKSIKAALKSFPPELSPLIAVAAGAALTAILPYSGLALFTSGFASAFAPLATMNKRARRIIYILTPVAGLIAGGALIPASMTRHHADVSAANKQAAAIQAATLLFNAAQKDCLSAKGQVFPAGTKTVCLYADPAKPTGGSFVYLPPVPSNR